MAEKILAITPIRTDMDRRKAEPPSKRCCAFEGEGVVRGHWPMGRVTEVHPSEDGLVHIVSIQVNGTTAKQPITKVALLVASDDSER